MLTNFCFGSQAPNSLTKGFIELAVVQLKTDYHADDTDISIQQCISDDVGDATTVWYDDPPPYDWTNLLIDVVTNHFLSSFVAVAIRAEEVL